jgi:hypothetical protein
MTKELDMPLAASKQMSGKRRKLVFLIIAEFLALAAATVAMSQLNLGWLGAILIALVLAAFTFMLFRAGEDRAKELGNFSPAMGSYNRRMLAASAIYVVGLFGAIWVHDALHPSGPIAFLTALAPSVGVLMMVWSMGRLITEETDEYLRHRYLRSSLFGLGTLLTLATIWGFFEQFDLVPHVPTWAAVPVFAIGLGLANCTSWGRQ